MGRFSLQGAIYDVEFEQRFDVLNQADGRKTGLVAACTYRMAPDRSEALAIHWAALRWMERGGSLGLLPDMYGLNWLGMLLPSEARSLEEQAMAHARGLMRADAERLAAESVREVATCQDAEAP